MPERSEPTEPAILVVDDDDQIRAMLSRLLSRSAFRVHVASNGRRALTVLDEEAIDLLITDIIMPVKEGIELITTVRAQRPSLPVIAISGGGRVDPGHYLELAKTLGANRVLGKPFDIDELLEACRQLTAKA